MLIDILNKVSVMLLMLSIINVIRHLFFVIGSFIKADEENPQKYRLYPRELWLLGLSIAYILTTIFTGIKF